MKTESFFIGNWQTIKEAMVQMDNEGIKTLFIVEDRKLLGVLSDSDIRAHILKAGKLSETVMSCCNATPITLSVYDKELGIRMLSENKVDAIPIVDSDKTVTGCFSIYFLDDCDRVYRQVDYPVVIMAGGKGTRLAPFTRVLPKPLIPIGEKPFIDIIMERFQKFGAQDFYITVNYMAHLIKAYFNGSHMDYNVHFIEEGKFMGTAGSLGLLPDNIGERFFLSNCDILVDVDMADLMDFHIKSENFITIVGSVQHYKMPYGVLHLDNSGRLDRVEEKPEIDFTINTGVYVIESAALEYLPENEFIHITDLIDILCQKGHRVGVYPVSEKSYLDIGQWPEYKKNAQKLCDLTAL